MNQSSDKRVDERAVLLQHGRELVEFADLLAEFGVAVETRAKGLPSLEELEGARLVIVVGRRLLEGRTPDLGLWPRTIAVVDDSSRTLVSQLNRIGVSMVVRRPIHPRALRLLLLREIYCGPEKRGRRRISIGHPIRVGSGLFKSRATLLELSPNGARIATTHPTKVGARLRIVLGKDLTRGKPLKLQGTIVRCIRLAKGRSGDAYEVGVSLARAGGHVIPIKNILARYASGPACWKEAGRGLDVEPDSPTGAGREPVAAAAVSERPLSCESSARAGPAHDAANPDRIVRFAPVCEAGNANPGGSTAVDSRDAGGLATGAEVVETGSGGARDRRGTTRVPYERRVVALGEEAARVLVGRDLSPGGMRIDATPGVALGDVLRVALHSGTRSDPMIVVANVVRDDGEAGLVLCFSDLSPRQREQLDQIIDSSGPIHVNPDCLEGDGTPPSTGGSIIVAEMLDPIAREAGKSGGVAGPGVDSFVDAGEPIEDAR